MTAFAGWLDSKTNLTYGVEADGVLKAIEDVAVVDNGATAWLQALRVHPDLRRQGVARRLQLHVIDKVLREFPAIRQLRYTTGGWNTASLRLGASCGMDPTHEWGVLLFQDTGVSEPEPVAKVDGDAVKYRQISFVGYKEAILAEHSRVHRGTGETSDQVVEVATATDVDAISQLEGGVVAMPPAWIVDWKCVARTPATLDGVFAKGGWGCRQVRCSRGAGGFAYGITRADFKGKVRVATVGAQYIDGHNDLGYAAMLLLLSAEVQQAISDGADSLMFFYDKCFQDRLIQANLGTGKTCVLLERKIDAERVSATTP